MRRKIVIGYLVALCALQVSTHTMACGAHFGLNTQNMGFLGRTAARMAGLAPPERVFKIKHSPTALVTVGEAGEIQVAYSRPLFAKDVRIELSASQYVVLSDDKLSLDERTGIVSIRFEVTEKGYNTIDLTVQGEHKGKLVSEHSRIYIGSRVKPATEDMQVSAR